MPEPDDHNLPLTRVNDAEDWVVQQVLAGIQSPAEAAERLGISVGAVLRLTRARTKLTSEDDETAKAAIHDTNSERFTENWTKAQEGVEPQAEELPPLEAAVQSIAPIRWLFGSERRRIVVAVAACGVLGIGIFAIARINKEPSPNSSLSSGESTAPPLPDRDDYEPARQVAQTFLRANTWEEKAELVRWKESVLPLMRNWYSERNMPLLVVEDADFVEAKGTIIGETSFVVLEAAQADGQPIVLAVDISSDPPKVDWGSHVHYQPTSWEQFKRERPTEPLSFRVRIEPSHYYAPPFEDQERWGSVRLTSPGGVLGLNGFGLQDSDLGVQLAHLLEFRRKEAINVIAELRFPSDTLYPVVELTSIEEGWISNAP